MNGGSLPVVFGGVPVPAGGTLPTIASNGGAVPVLFGAGGAPNVVPVGQTGHGTNFLLFRPFFSGQMDSHWSYGIRLKAQLTTENAVGGSVISPSLCPNTTTTNCSFSDLSNGNNTIPINLDYAYLQYNTPSGIGGAIGRVVVTGSDYFLTAPDSFLIGGASLTGMSLFYNDPKKRLFGALYYGFPSVSSYATFGANGTPQTVCTAGILGYNSGASQPPLSGVNPNCNGTGQSLMGNVTYHIAQTGTTFNAIGLLQQQQQFMYWDPAYVNSCVVGAVSTVAVSTAACAANKGVVGPANGAFGNYLTGLGNFSYGEAAISQEFGPHDKRTWRVDVDGLLRFGNDPFTGNPWVNSGAFLSSLTYASKGNIYAGTPNPMVPQAGIKNSNVGYVFYGAAGFNSTAGPSYLTAPISPLAGLGAVNYNGMSVVGASVHHWFSDNVRVGLWALHLNELPGIALPVGTNGGASTCRGCFVNGLSANYLYLETWLYFN